MKIYITLAFSVMVLITNAQNQMAIWTFSKVSKASKRRFKPSAEVLIGKPYLTQKKQNIDKNGKKGIAYTDVENILHKAKKAIAWDDIKGAGTDAELYIEFNTTEWKNIFIRFDYKSRSADAFDIEYSLDGGTSWDIVVRQTPIFDGYNWNVKTYDLSAYTAVNDQQSVTLRLSNFDNTGNNELVFDNIELIGIKIGKPHISIDTDWNTDYLNLNLNDSGSTNGAVNDPTDPARTKGIYFLVKDLDTPINMLTITATSSNTTVVPNTNLILTTLNSSIVKLNITPISDGYTNIIITVNDDSYESSYTINYASSLPDYETSNTNFKYGYADASASIEVGDNYIIVADDENNSLNLYQKDSSGFLFNQFDMGAPMGLTIEGDFEASFKKNDRAYWMGSLGNSKNGNIRPDRHYFFATDIIDSGKNTLLNYVGNYDMRTPIIDWGDSYGYDFSSSAAFGQAPKQIDGFNVEGMALGPNQTSFYIGFRAPLVSSMGFGARTKALICPVENFEYWFNNGNPIGNPTFGNPIELDLAGRSIRSIKRNDNGEYLIVAGDYDTGNVTFALYKWGGQPTDVPILLTADLTDFNPEGIVHIPSPLVDGSEVELVSDDGTRVYYGDGVLAKNLTNTNYKKFRIRKVSTMGAGFPPPYVAQNNISRINYFDKKPPHHRIKKNYGKKEIYPIVGSTKNTVAADYSVINKYNFIQITSNIEQISSYRLISLNGNIVLNNSFQNSVVINKNGIAEGIYILYLSNKQGSTSIKVKI